MSINREYEEVSGLLERFGQRHLLTFWNELTKDEKENLLNDIREIDLPTFVKDLEDARKNISALNRKEMVDDDLEPPPSEVCGSWNDSTPEQLEMYNEIGLEYISRGKYCSILMAGGAGTRLGVNYPKGMFKVGLPSDKSLFQLQAERILRLQYLAYRRFEQVVPITWYIMTSDCTKTATKDYFEQNNYFGLDENQVIFFEQFTLPVVGSDGKIILETKSKISKSPDGNGGLYRALQNTDLIRDMIKRNIEYAIVYGVDNILVKIADPVFLGFCVEKGVECAAKVVEKVDPKEAVGIVGKVKGKFRVVEYSEISIETATMRNSNDNKLMYRSGNICTHLFSVDFLSRICQNKWSDQMAKHIAIKKVPFININTGCLETPEKENAIKMEKFVFDVFRFADTFAIWEVERKREFSPLKNSSGSKSDCPETSRNNLLAYHRQLILENIKEPSLKCKVKTMTIEISPLVSYSGEDLKNVYHKISKCEEGSLIHLENIMENGKS